MIQAFSNFKLTDSVVADFTPVPGSGNAVHTDDAGETGTDESIVIMYKRGLKRTDVLSSSSSSCRPGVDTSTFQLITWAAF